MIFNIVDVISISRRQAVTAERQPMRASHLGKVLTTHTTRINAQWTCSLLTRICSATFEAKALF